MASTSLFAPLQNGGAATPAAARRMAIWLFVMCGLVAAMVIVGGATRLTDSGLSITEWKPVTGAIPPMSEADWLSEFEKYKAIPEYNEVNYGMSLSEFKEIYWWEWGHRFLGRMIGFAFLIPLIFFAATKQVTKPLAIKLGGLFLLGGMQGALGWWMVTSGLADRVDVSQYRLAAHLALAVTLFACMFWLALDLWPAQKISAPKNLSIGALVLAAGVFIQMMLGAFVAGLRAGRTFNTWPLMDGQFFPDGYFHGAPGLNDLFETAAAAQFNHRIGAYLVAAGAIWFWIAARKTAPERFQEKWSPVFRRKREKLKNLLPIYDLLKSKSAIESRARLVLAAVGLQIVLGIWTVLAATPISLGLLHQAGALGVLAAALFAAHGTKSPARA